MARYRVNTRFVFSGVFEVEADSRAEARELVMKECGLVMGGSIHTTLDDEEVDWDFDRSTSVSKQASAGKGAPLFNTTTAIRTESCSPA